MGCALAAQKTLSPSPHSDAQRRRLKSLNLIIGHRKSENRPLAPYSNFTIPDFKLRDFKIPQIPSPPARVRLNFPRMLTPLAPDLWDYNEPLRVFGMALGHRMTVVRLPSGKTWVHSPATYSGELLSAIQRHGALAHLVAPNGVHDTFLEEWFATCPRTRFHAPAALSRARPDFHFTDTLTATPHSDWADVLDQHILAGMPRIEEVVFLHRPSRTLILTDLVFNLSGEMPFLSRTLLKLNGCYCKLGPSRLLRSVIKDRGALRASLDHILAWDFDRVILSHGENLGPGAKEKLREALVFL